MSTMVFRLERVTLRQRQANVLDSISLTQRAGTILGVTGFSDSGHSALVHILAGLAKPTSGRVSVLLGSPLQASVRKDLGLALRPEHLDREATAEEALFGWCRIKGFASREAARMTDALLKELPLASTSAVGDWPQTRIRLLCVSAALVGNPKLILLEDAFDDLEPSDQDVLASMLRERASQGATVVLANRPTAAWASCCDRIALMDRGCLLGAGTPEEIRTSLAGLLFKYEIKGHWIDSMPEADNLHIQTTDSGATILADRDISDLMAHHDAWKTAVQIKPTFEEACLWILRNPKAIATRSKLWNQDPLGEAPTSE